MKKRTSILLLIALLASAASCGESAASAETTAASGTESTTAAETLPAGIESCDYGGKTFTILAPSWGLYKNYFFAEEQNGEVMNDALYERDLIVEDYLGVSIEHLLQGTINDIMPSVQAAVMAGDDTYSLVLTHCIMDVANMVTSGLLYDFNDIPSIDLDADWWNKNANENLQIYGAQFYAVSDYMIPDPNCILFNKDFITQYKLENPYDLVRSGKWTIDKMVQMCSVITKDVDGNSVFDANDQYGMASPNDWYLNSFNYSSDLFLVDKDDEGGYKLVFGGERAATLVEKMHKFLKGPDCFLYRHTAKEEEKFKINRGRSLFQIDTFNQMHLLRDTEVDFGILPYPKFDEQQADYYNNDWSGLMCMPATIGDPEMNGKVIELLSYHSASTVLPAYHELVLGEKLSRDEDSKEMVALIFDNIVFDAGMNYFGFTSAMQQLFYTLSYHVVGGDSGEFASFYASYEEFAKADIEEFNKAARDAIKK